MLNPRDHVVLRYPAKNIVSPRYRIMYDRPIIVRSVRDLASEPLTPEEFLAKPCIKRGRWLVKATDLDTNTIKQFYLAASEEYERDEPLWLVLRDESDVCKPIKTLAGPFEPTREDMKKLSMVLRQCMACDFGGLVLRVACYGLRLVSAIASTFLPILPAL